MAHTSWFVAGGGENPRLAIDVILNEGRLQTALAG